MTQALEKQRVSFVPSKNGLAASHHEGSLKLTDITVQTRMGVRGRKATSFLEQEGVALPIKPNTLTVLPQGVLVLRLSQTEHWLVDISGTASDGLEALNVAAQHQAELYPLYCQHSHAAFTLKGAPLADCLAKICGVDLSESVFPMGSVAQTSVARVNAIIAKYEWQGEVAFLILSDVASSHYLWDAIIDAKAEFVD
jgi:sarcosine oxidase subunit gamma